MVGVALVLVGLVVGVVDGMSVELNDINAALKNLASVKKDIEKEGFPIPTNFSYLDSKLGQADLTDLDFNLGISRVMGRLFMYVPFVTDRKQYEKLMSIFSEISDFEFKLIDPVGRGMLSLGPQAPLGHLSKIAYFMKNFLIKFTKQSSVNLTALCDKRLGSDFWKAKSSASYATEKFFDLEVSEEVIVGVEKAIEKAAKAVDTESRMPFAQSRGVFTKLRIIANLFQPGIKVVGSLIKGITGEACSSSPDLSKIRNDVINMFYTHTFLEINWKAFFYPMRNTFNIQPLLSVFPPFPKTVDNIHRAKEAIKLYLENGAREAKITKYVALYKKGEENLQNVDFKKLAMALFYLDMVL